MSIPAGWESAVVGSTEWSVVDGALKSNTITHNERTELSLNVIATVIITVSVSSEASYDFLDIERLDGGSYTNLLSISGEKTQEVALEPGEYRFTYRKDGSANSGDDCAQIIHIPDAAFWSFDGDLTQNRDNWESKIIINPTNEPYTITDGVGLTNDGSNPLYLKTANELVVGCTFTLLADDAVLSTLVLERDSTSARITLDGNTVEIEIDAAKAIYFEAANGYAVLHDGFRILCQSAMPSALLNTTSIGYLYTLQPGATESQLVEYGVFLKGFALYLSHSLTSSLIRANSESLEQAFPNPVLREHMLPQPAYIEACRGHRLYLHRPNGERYQFGYIANVVTANGLPMPDRRVLCLTQSGELVGETRSDSNGNYRFDGLYLDERYMLVAQDKPAFSEGAEYNAVAADFQAPTAYEFSGGA